MRSNNITIPSTSLHLTCLITFKLFILFPFSVFCQDFPPNLQKAYQEAFALRLNNAQKIIQQEKEQTPFKIYTESCVEMLNLMVSEDEAHYEEIKQNEDIRLNILEKMPKDSPYKLFLQAEIRLHGALLKLRFGHDVAGAWDIIKAYRLLAENETKFPQFLPNKKFFGALHILIGSAPEAYIWVAKVLGLQGDVKKGLKELQEVIQKDKIWANEAIWISLYLQGYVLKWSENTQKNLAHFVQRNPDNLLISFLAVAISIKNNQSENAFNYLKDKPLGKDYISMPIMLWYDAEINLQKGNYLQAERGFINYLNQHRGKSFLKESYLKLFLCRYLNKEQGEIFLKKIPVVGNTFAESDKAAQKFYEEYDKTKRLVSVPLLKARLTFDGGFYDKAFMCLQPFDEEHFTTNDDKTEYNYRLARIEQKMGKTNLAIKHFERAITLSETLPETWIGAASCLQLGYIFQEKGDNIMAKKYFEKTISYKKHTYKNSFDNKARAAMKN